ncbi:3-phenylpropionate MFS transporter [Thaumasiovibrio subtropicus]|uniref:3-phenylpropionate MFS transporter n=1 Tax=Thaumasiovibrio subtropicus TaxID=1891207 RepID=UPI000B358B3A|nr:3-phenylpropionate MFS transporter [Thaumasiovibrio subtropicus]
MLSRTPYGWTSQYLFGYFFSYGVYLPFWAIWLSYMGMSPSEVGLITGAGFVTRALCNLLVTPKIHRPEQMFPALRWVTWGSVAIMALHLVVGNNFWVLALATVGFNFLSAPIMPLSDSVANHYQSRQLLDYGRTRLWGSIAFVVGTWVVGRATDSFGESTIPYLALAGLAMAAILCECPPKQMPVGEDKVSERPNLWQMLKRRDVQVFLLVTALLQGSHAAYYTFGSIHWRSFGISDSTISNLWSVSVVAEIMIFLVGKNLFTHWSVTNMMRLAAVGAMVRWTILGTSSDLYLLAFMQALHCITFAVAHLGAIKFIQQQAESERIAWQSLYNAIPLGLIMGGLTFASGKLYELYNAQLFLAMVAFVVPVFLFNVVPIKQKSDGRSQSDVAEEGNH